MFVKKLIYSLIVLGIIIGIYAYNNPLVDFSKDDKLGITFYKGTWAAALAKAKQENKLIFLDIYATWCGPCKKLKKYSFASEKAGTYFNTHFINVSFDGEVAEGETVALLYNITNYPSLLFINADGRVVSRTDGFMNDEDLIKFGTIALQKFEK